MNLSFRNGTALISALKVCTSARKCMIIHFKLQFIAYSQQFILAWLSFWQSLMQPVSREPATCQLHWNYQFAFSSHDPAEVRTPAPIITAMNKHSWAQQGFLCSGDHKVQLTLVPFIQQVYVHVISFRISLMLQNKTKQSLIMWDLTEKSWKNPPALKNDFTFTIPRIIVQ